MAGRLLRGGGARVKKVVFIGASKLGLRCLQVLKSLPCVEVVGVITIHKTFSISYAPRGVTNCLHADIAAFAASCNIPLYTMRDKMNEPGLIECVEKWSPDLFLVAGWYHMVTKQLRAIAPALGLHASLLPDYSGGAPLVWAMINGESKGGH
jgi:methionyl-tRNA formyltransferase